MTSSTRTLVAVIGVIVVVLAAAVVGTSYSSGRDWAAKVGTSTISEHEFLRELREFRQNDQFTQQYPQLAQAQQGTVAADLSAAWLGQLIQQQVVDDEIAHRGGVDITPDIRQQAEQIAEQTFQGKTVLDGFDPWFKNRLVERYSRLLALVESVGGRPTEAELRHEYDANPQAYQQACASHILVDTLQEAQQIKQQLDAGADFAQLAKEKSKDTGSAAQGGDLGCQPKGTFVAPFDQAVWSLPLNTVSDPVQTQFGYHLIIVRQRGTKSFEEAKPEIEQKLLSQSQQKFNQFLLGRLREVHISVNPKYGTFEVTDQGPRVTPPSAPQPPEGRPTGDTGQNPVPGQGGLVPQPQQPPSSQG